MEEHLRSEAGPRAIIFQLPIHLSPCYLINITWVTFSLGFITRVSPLLIDLISRHIGASNTFHLLHSNIGNFNRYSTP